MGITILIYIVYIYFALYSVVLHASQENRVLTFPSSTKNVKDTCAAKILTEAYSRLGIKINFIEVPAQRALIATSRGKFDGLLNRISGQENNFKNLLKVKVPICFNYYSFYVRENTEHIIDNIEDHIIGIKKGNTPLERMFSNYEVHTTTTYKQLVKMLAQGHIDVIAMNIVSFKVIRNEPDFKKFTDNITEVKYKIPVVNGYHYLAAKNRALQMPLEEKLRMMETEGIIQKINDESNN